MYDDSLSFALSTPVDLARTCSKASKYQRFLASRMLQVIETGGENLNELALAEEVAEQFVQFCICKLTEISTSDLPAAVQAATQFGDERTLLVLIDLLSRNV